MGEFWLGLDKIHRLTSTGTELRVDLQDFWWTLSLCKVLKFQCRGFKIQITIYQYQDTVELLATLLHIIMDISSVQEIKTMMLIQVAVVHRATKVAGGTMFATIQTSMVSTMVDHTHPLLMAWTGTHGRDTITPSNSPRWKCGNKKWLKKWLLLVVLM